MRLVWIALLFVLAGCSERRETLDAEEYLSRLSRILQLETPDLPTQTIVRSQPKPRALSDTRIAITEALRLGPCGLVPLIAERNSSLGRQKAASQQFLYEWELSVGLAACIEQTPETPDWLQAAQLNKAKDRETALWNLLFASDTADALHSSLDSGDASLADAWERYQVAFVEVRRFALLGLDDKAGPELAQKSAFESALATLESTRVHGQLRRLTLDTLTLLHTANQVQAQRLAKPTLCPLGTPTEQGRRLQSFVTTYFATTVQPHLADIQRYQRALDALWKPIAKPLELPNTLEARLDQLLQLPAGTHSAYSAAMSTHIRHWQDLLSACGLSPARATTNSYD